MTPRPERGILDTSAVIRLGELDPSVLPTEAVITAITLAELSVGPLLVATDIERAVRLRHLQQAEASFGEALPFDADAARAFASVSAALRQGGRKTSARSYDALIASIALSRDLPIYTFNPGDFEGTGVHVVGLAAA